MPATIERQAPPAPDQRPNDAELYNMVYGHPSEPDEIVYRLPAGTFFTSREERARAHKLWQDAGEVHRPTTADDITRTEDMLRLRNKYMNEQESPEAHRALAAYAEQLGGVATPQVLENMAAQATSAERYDEPTGEFSPIGAAHPADTQSPPVIPGRSTASTPEATPHYVGRHRRRTGMRVPLHRLIRHYRPRHRATT